MADPGHPDKKPPPSPQGQGEVPEAAPGAPRSAGSPAVGAPGTPGPVGSGASAEAAPGAPRPYGALKSTGSVGSGEVPEAASGAPRPAGSPAVAAGGQALGRGLAALPMVDVGISAELGLGGVGGKRCEDCGATYGDHAEYCNACGGERLRPLAPPPPPPPTPLRGDRGALVAAGLTWLLGLGYVLGALRPRGGLQLVEGWLSVAFASGLLALLFANARPFILFGAVGLVSTLIYGLVKL